jgi:diadenosine tetraphosphate (Ap4A) HIT family hydrolase
MLSSFLNVRIVSRPTNHIYDLTYVLDHTEKMHELPEEYLADVLPIAKRIAVAQGLDNFNILQVPFYSFDNPEKPV